MATLLFSCGKDEKSMPEKLSDQITQVSMDAIVFIDKWIAYETTVYRPENLSMEEARAIIDDYITAGEAFAKSLGVLLEQSSGKDMDFVGLKNDDALSCAMAVVGEFGISGLSGNLAIKVADIIKGTKDARQAIDDAYDNGDLDEFEYWEAVAELPHIHNMNLEKITGSAILGTGAAGLTGYAIAQSSAGGAALAWGSYGLGVTIGAPLVVGGTVAYGTYRLFSWYTSSDKDGVEMTHLVSFPWEFDKPIPAFLFHENSKVAISMDDYAPILIESLVLPEDDYNIRIEFEAIPYSDLDSKEYGAKSTYSEVCFYKDPIQPGEDCNEILFVMGEPFPPNPAPHQGVTVVATLMPVTPDCDIHFSIVGTDGYTNSATYSSNHGGQASFYIPGAMPGVFDKVSITTSSGASHTVSYYFGGSAKDFDPDAASPRR